MPKRALAERRPFLLASIVAALAFFYLRAGPWPELYLIPLKGAALVLLAMYAWLRHSSQDARLLAIALLIAAGGEMALEIDLLAGHALYFGYLIVALMLYLRHTRPVLAGSQKWAMLALFFLPGLILYFLAASENEMSYALYGLAAGGTAAGAWASSFPRYRVGAGAALFLLANLLLLAGNGPLAGSLLPQIFVWPLAYLGQFLIAIGVIQTLRKRDPELRLVSSRRD